MIISSLSGRVLAVMLALGAAGCASMDIRAGTARVATGPGSVTSTRVQVSTDSALATRIVVGVLLAEGLRHFLQAPDGTRTPLPGVTAEQVRMWPPRVSVQECARPVDPAAGNLRCR
ncbi:MAG: hypothetical protein FJY55_05825 [Betaproteobacteria bacterium]|nr:hypothetical protein [Betaproteobacteria bacterium]